MATSLATALLPAPQLGLGESILFGVVAVIAVVCALGVLTAKRAVYAAVNMIMIMICLATLYIANSAPFLGAVQIVVYTGAVMMLVLFVIMLVGVAADESIADTVSGHKLLSSLMGLGLVITLVTALMRSQLVGPAKFSAEIADDSIGSLAKVLFNDYATVMELTGLLLITAALGALTLTHRESATKRRGQAQVAKDKLEAYAKRGEHPGQKPFSGVYATTNSAAAPAVDASGKLLDESVSRVLRIRGQMLNTGALVPKASAPFPVETKAQVENAVHGHSGMDAMNGAPAPQVSQPLAAEAETSADAAKEEK